MIVSIMMVRTRMKYEVPFQQETVITGIAIFDFRKLNNHYRKSTSDALVKFLSVRRTIINSKQSYQFLYSGYIQLGFVREIHVRIK